MKTLLKVFILSVMLCSPVASMDAQQQIQVPTVQQQVEIRQATECEQKVRHYRELKETKPNPYINFMFKLWYKRCPDQ